jgi:hypothetical protein
MKSTFQSGGTAIIDDQTAMQYQSSNALTSSHFDSCHLKFSNQPANKA